MTKKDKEIKDHYLNTSERNLIHALIQDTIHQILSIRDKKNGVGYSKRILLVEEQRLEVFPKWEGFLHSRHIQPK